MYVELGRTDDGGERRLCRDCRQPFTISQGEAEWMLSKGFRLPAWCPACRQARKAMQGQQDHDAA